MKWRDVIHFIIIVLGVLAMLFSIAMIISSWIVPTPAHAGDLTVIYGPGCYHFDRSTEHKEDNHALGLEYNQWFIITFPNSQNDRSWFAGYDFHTDRWQVFSLDTDWFWMLHARAGMLYGYDLSASLGGWTPAVLPSAELGYKVISLEGSYVPLDGGVATAVIKYRVNVEDKIEDAIKRIGALFRW